MQSQLMKDQFQNGRGFQCLHHTVSWSHNKGWKKSSFLSVYISSLMQMHMCMKLCTLKQLLVFIPLTVTTHFLKYLEILYFCQRGLTRNAINSTAFSMHFTVSWSEWAIWNIQCHENSWSSNPLCWKMLFIPEISDFSGQIQLKTHKPKLLIYELILLWVTAVILRQNLPCYIQENHAKSKKEKKIQLAWRASPWNLHLI